MFVLTRVMEYYEGNGISTIHFLHPALGQNKTKNQERETETERDRENEKMFLLTRVVE